MRIRKPAAAVLSFSTAFLYSLVALQGSAQADPLPAPYSGSADGSILDLDADVATLDIAAAQIGLSSARANSTQTPAATATSSNLTAAVAGLPLKLDSVTATAPPIDDPAQKDLISLPLGPVLALKAITGDVSANFDTTASCVPAVDGQRVLGSSRTALAGASLVGVQEVASVLEVGAAKTTSTTKLVDQAGSGAKMVSETTTTVGDIKVLGNLGAVVKVTSPVVLTAESDGTTGSTSYSDPLITVTVAGSDPIEVTPEGGAVTVPINIPAVLNATLTVSAFAPTETLDGPSATASLDAILALDLTATTVVGIVELADVHLGIGEMSATATAPEGGVECEDTTAPAAPVISAPADGSTVASTTPPISGTGEAGATVTVTEGGTTIGTATVQPDGTWSLTPENPLADGPHTIVATQTVEAGNPSAVSEAVDFTIDSAVPAAPVITAPADGSVTNDTTPTITGTGEPGAEVEVNVDAEVVGTTEVDETGNWELPVTTPLAPGAHTVSATQTDDAGNDSNPVTSDFTIDTESEDIAITGPGEGETTNDSTPTISGTGEPGASVEVSVDGEVIDTVTVETDGTWSIEVTQPLDEGQHTIDAEQTDGSGNTADAEQVTFTVDLDSDDDGVDDGDEITNGTDPNDADTDNDGLKDGREDTLGTDPLNPDTDGDTLKDGREVNRHRTNPLRRDTDGDTLWDNTELRGSANTKYGKRPTNPLRKDTDRDGLHDGREVKGFKMGLRVRVGKGKFHKVRRIRTNPRVRDTDRDGLIDGHEVKGKKVNQRIRTKGGSYRLRLLRSNPLAKDTDRDGLRDKAEVTGNRNKKFRGKKTDPANFDTDRGSVGDGKEVHRGSDPTNHYSGVPKRRTNRMIG